MNRTFKTTIVTLFLNFCLTAQAEETPAPAKIQRLIAAKPPAAEPNPSEAEQKLFKRLLPLLRTVQENYLTPLSDDELLNALQRGLPSALDPDSSYRSRAEFREMRNEQPIDQRAGIGLELRMPQDAPVFPTVVATIDNGPAARAGLRSGDRLLAANEISLRGLPLEKVVTQLRGSEGSTLNLHFQRDGRLQEVTLTRELVQIPPLTMRSLQQVAYLRPSAFGYRTAKGFAEQLAVLDKLPEEKRPQALVLDLRNHSGGTLQGAVAAAAAFLPRNTLVARLQGRKTEDNTELRTTPLDYGELDDPFAIEPLSQHWKAIPLTVLIDHATANGAELLAAALRHHGRAKLVGTKSMGVTAIRSLHQLPDGDALILLSARWAPPTGEPPTQGIEPDIAVTESVPAEEFGQLPKDAILQRALQLLKKE